MNQRCNNKKNKDYCYYGGRGITICDEWKTLDDFREWAFKNGYTNKTTLDRKDNEKGYSPENCRWVNEKWIQCVNRRKFKNSKSEYIGVVKYGEKSWTSRLGLKGVRYHLGTYETEIGAAIAYNIASVTHHKEYANLNKTPIDFKPEEELIEKIRISLSELASRTSWKDAISILGIYITPTSN